LDFIRSVERFNATFKFFKAIRPLLQTIGILFEGINPGMYKEYIDNYNSFVKHSPYKILKVSKWACFLRLALLRNATVGPHKDSEDVKKGWVVMCTWGE
jgi:hypothetical protein